MGKKKGIFLEIILCLLAIIGMGILIHKKQPQETKTKQEESNAKVITVGNYDMLYQILDKGREYSSQIISFPENYQQKRMLSDGEYFYTAHSRPDETDLVQILCPDKKGLHRVWKISTGVNTSLYLQGSRLIIIYGEGVWDDEIVRTHVLSFDVSDPEAPKKISDLTQSGSPDMAEEKDGMLYLFTRQGIEPGVEEGEIQYIPEVEGEMVPADKIYMASGQQADQYTLLTVLDEMDTSHFRDFAAVLSCGDIQWKDQQITFQVEDFDVMLVEREGMLQPQGAKKLSEEELLTRHSLLWGRGTNGKKTVRREYPFGKDLTLNVEVKDDTSEDKLTIKMIQDSTDKIMHGMYLFVKNQSGLSVSADNILVDHQHGYVGIGSRQGPTCQNRDCHYHLYRYDEAEGLFSEVFDYSWDMPDAEQESMGWIRGNEVYVISPDGEQSVVYHVVSGQFSKKVIH